MIAFCYNDGLICFSQRLPKNARYICHGPARAVRGVIAELAAHDIHGQPRIVGMGYGRGLEMLDAFYRFALRVRDRKWPGVIPAQYGWDFNHVQS